MLRPRANGGRSTALGGRSVLLPEGRGVWGFVCSVRTWTRLLAVAAAALLLANSALIVHLSSRQDFRHHVLGHLLGERAGPQVQPPAIDPAVPASALPQQKLVQSSTSQPRQEPKQPSQHQKQARGRRQEQRQKQIKRQQQQRQQKQQRQQQQQHKQKQQRQQQQQEKRRKQTQRRQQREQQRKRQQQQRQQQQRKQQQRKQQQRKRQQRKQQQRKQQQRKQQQRKQQQQQQQQRKRQQELQKQRQQQPKKQQQRQRQSKHSSPRRRPAVRGAAAVGQRVERNTKRTKRSWKKPPPGRGGGQQRKHGHQPVKASGGTQQQKRHEQQARQVAAEKKSKQQRQQAVKQAGQRAAARRAEERREKNRSRQQQTRERIRKRNQPVPAPDFTRPLAISQQHVQRLGRRVNPKKLRARDDFAPENQYDFERMRVKGRANLYQSAVRPFDEDGMCNRHRNYNAGMGSCASLLNVAVVDGAVHIYGVDGKDAKGLYNVKYFSLGGNQAPRPLRVEVHPNEALDFDACAKFGEVVEPLSFIWTPYRINNMFHLINSNFVGLVNMFLHGSPLSHKVVHTTPDPYNLDVEVDAVRQKIYKEPRTFFVHFWWKRRGGLTYPHPPISLMELGRKMVHDPPQLLRSVNLTKNFRNVMETQNSTICFRHLRVGRLLWPFNAGRMLLKGFEGIVWEFQKYALYTYGLKPRRSMPVRGTFPRIVYLQRSCVGRARCIVNKQDLKKAFEAYNKAIQVDICCEDWGDIKSVLKRVSSAHIAIGFHGANLANAVFMRPGSYVYELQPIYSKLYFHMLQKHLNVTWVAYDIRRWPLYRLDNRRYQTAHYANRTNLNALVKTVMSNWKKHLENPHYRPSFFAHSMGRGGYRFSNGRQGAFERFKNPFQYPKREALPLWKP